ncbi:MAG: hypothetical protein ABR591_01855 [Candidatus Velthaea sp.]
MLHERPLPSAVPDGVVAGAVILGCGVLSIAVITHHPVVHAHTAAQLMRAIAETGTANRIVHGMLIAFMFALSFGLSTFALRQGMQHPANVAGLIAYLAGAGAVSFAALIDGFFIAAVAAANANASGAALAGVVAVIAGGAAMIQVLTAFGFVALSCGILLWSLRLVRSAGSVRYAGVLGIAAAVIPPVSVMTSRLHITPGTLVSTLVPEALWYAAIGTLMIRRIL